MLITTVLQTTILALSLTTLDYTVAWELVLVYCIPDYYFVVLLLQSLNMQYDLLLVMGMLENI